MKKRILVVSVLSLAALAAALFAGYRLGKAKTPSVSTSEQRPERKIMYNCAMHPQYISDKPGSCPICGMKLTPMDRHSGTEGSSAGANGGMPGDTGSIGVRIDPATVQNMGVKTEPVRRMDLRTEVRASGRIMVDESRLSIVNARVMGYAEKLNVNVTGQTVSKGQTLLELYSPDLVSTQEEFLQALRYRKDAGDAAETGSGDLVESSRRRLLNWGISPAEIAALEKLGRARNTLAIASPATGVVLAKNVVAGQNVMPGMELYRIADLSRVWVVANIYQRDLAAAKVGAEAEVELNYQPGKPYRGRLTFISPVLDERTKTAEVRIEVPNTKGFDLKPEMFATVRILSPARENVVAVPEQAIIRSGRRTLAIIAEGNGFFRPREITLGAAGNDYVEVLDGIREGEILVVSSQFLIDSESNLKAAIRQLQSAPAPAPVRDAAGIEGTGGAQSIPSAGDSAKAGDGGAMYTCPMHPEVRNHGPGQCPICGMDLVPKKK